MLSPQIELNMFNEKLNKMDEYLNYILSEQISVDFNEINQLISDIESSRNKLKAKYSAKLLNENSENLSKITKQIVNTLDSIIRNKELERQTVAEELRKLQNKKKIANYIR